MNSVIKYEDPNTFCKEHKCKNCEIYKNKIEFRTTKEIEDLHIPCSQNIVRLNENKKLIELYPFLLPQNVKNYDYSWTELDSLPIGWKKAFGLLICEDIKKELVKNNLLDSYCVIEIKEKYGSLRWYDFNATKEITNIITKYEHISSFVCVDCGKINVPIYDFGWISPNCPKCLYDKFKNNKAILNITDIEKFKYSNALLTPTFYVNVFCNGKKKKILYDCSDILSRMGANISTLPKLEDVLK